MSGQVHEQGPWYRGITGYQWLVLVLASLGWVFDVFEGQIFAITRDDFRNLLEREPTIAVALLPVLASRLVE